MDFSDLPWSATVATPHHTPANQHTFLAKVRSEGRGRDDSGKADAGQGAQGEPDTDDVPMALRRASRTSHGWLVLYATQRRFDSMSSIPVALTATDAAGPASADK